MRRQAPKSLTNFAENYLEGYSLDLDTTYLLPLARIAIDTDLLGAIAEGRTNLKLEEFGVSLISILELQAKAAKLMIPAKFTVKAVEAIFTAFRVKPFHETEIIDTSYELKRIIPDYIYQYRRVLLDFLRC